jgi:hypothetical protein
MAYQDWLNVIPVSESKRSVALRHVPLQVTAVAVVEQQGAGGRIGDERRLLIFATIQNSGHLFALLLSGKKN